MCLILLLTTMSSVFIDHKILKPYYNQDNVNITKIYEKGATLYHSEYKNYIILYINDNTQIATSFNITSDKLSTAYVCVYQIIVSKFLVEKGSNDYPNLILLYGNCVTLILDKSCILEVKMLSVCLSKCDLIKNYR